MEQLSLQELCWGNLEGGFFTGDPEGYVKKGSGDGRLSMGAPLGNLEGGLFTRDLHVEEVSGDRHLSSQETR